LPHGSCFWLIRGRFFVDFRFVLPVKRILPPIARTLVAFYPENQRKSRFLGVDFQ
jgi:hypothetical protein